MLGSQSERRQDPWKWFRVRGSGPRLSYAVALLCVCEVVVWTGATTSAVLLDGGATASSGDASFKQFAVASTETFRHGDVRAEAGVGQTLSHIHSAAQAGRRALEEAPMYTHHKPGSMSRQDPRVSGLQPTGGWKVNPKRPPDRRPPLETMRRRLAVLGIRQKNRVTADASAGSHRDKVDTSMLVGGGLAVAVVGVLSAMVVGARSLRAAGAVATTAGRAPRLGLLPLHHPTINMATPSGVRSGHPASSASTYTAPNASPGRLKQSGGAVAAGASTQGVHDVHAADEVPVHTHGLLEMLAHPAELIAGVRYKLAHKRSDEADGLDLHGLLPQVDLDDAAFCEDMLQKTSRSFAAVIQQLPPELRPCDTRLFFSLPHTRADSGWPTETIPYMCDVLKPPRHRRRSICVFYLVLRALDTVEDDMYAPLAPKLELLRSFHSLIATEQPSHLVIHGYGMTADERVLLTELPRLLRVLGALPPDQRHTIFSITERMGTVRGVALHLPKLSSV